MSSRPRISVVTPSFNQGRFIEDAIRSVLGQGTPGFEHIVVDAESTDETGEVLARYPHLRVIREPDEGQSDGLNKGFLAARGEYVCWLNADDYLLPGAFERLLQGARAHSRGRAFFGHYFMVDECGRHLRSMRVPPFDRGVCRHYGVCQPTSGAYFATSLFQEDGLLLDTDLHIVMDWDFYQRLAASDVSIVRLPAFLSCFRIHAENKSIGVADTDLGRRRDLDQRRRHERRICEYRYGVRTGLSEGLNSALARGLALVHRARFVASKAVRSYYLLNLIDRLRRPVVEPAR